MNLRAEKVKLGTAEPISEHTEASPAGQFRLSGALCPFNAQALRERKIP